MVRVWGGKRMVGLEEGGEDGGKRECIFIDSMK